MENMVIDLQKILDEEFYKDYLTIIVDVDVSAIHKCMREAIRQALEIASEVGYARNWEVSYDRGIEDPEEIEVLYEVDKDSITSVIKYVKP